MSGPCFSFELKDGVRLLRLHSKDGTNRLTRKCVTALQQVLQDVRSEGESLILAGNDDLFSTGAELSEIAALDGPEAYAFSRMGKGLMRAVEEFPAPVYAAVSGYCIGGGLDLALACRRRIAAPNAVFGHRGAALGLITGWGGTQRLPRLVGKGRALEIFVEAEKIDAREALKIGLVDAIANDPVADALRRIRQSLDRYAVRANAPCAVPT